MIFGILKDIKEEEFRVICTPMEVHSIRAAGHEVWAQHDCGKLAGFSDEAYAAAGARIVESAEELYAHCDMVAKVKEFTPAECAMMHPGQIVLGCIIGGAAYPIEVHGLADLLPWQVKTADDSAIELTLTPNGLTKFVYPFDFALTMRYTLCGSTATLALTVANTGDKALPFSVGFHPYFAASKLENVAFDINAATCSENAKGEQPAAPETITLTRKEGSADSIRLMTGVKSPMRLSDSGSGHKVTVAFDESVFTNAVLWQQDAESFVCMEPWNGWANSVNEEGRHIELNPGESKEFKWSVTIE